MDLRTTHERRSAQRFLKAYIGGKRVGGRAFAAVRREKEGGGLVGEEVPGSSPGWS